MTPIVVVGAGWAGLAAAAELSARGLPVTLLEAAQAPGGRARSVARDGHVLDNGQHLLLGAYRDTRALLARLDVREDAAFARLPLELRLHDARDGDLHLRGGRLPGRLHLAQGLLAARGPGPAERGRWLLAAARLSRPPQPAATVAQWLAATAQPPRMRRQLWEPLCLAALNTPAETASAEVFHRVLSEALASPERSALFIPARALGEVLPGPALDFLRRRGATIRLGARVRGLIVESGRVAGLELRDGERIEARSVALACGPRSGMRLLEPHAALAATAARLRRLDMLPIVTVYLAFDAAVRLTPPMQGLLDGPLQWVFDRRVCGDPGVLAGVISGPGEHLALDGTALAAQAARQLRRVLPACGEPLASWVVRERHATFAATPAAERCRPPSRTPLPGLWLAGDHIATGLPSTLEGAVRSGLQCARDIAAEAAAGNA